MCELKIIIQKFLIVQNVIGTAIPFAKIQLKLINLLVIRYHIYVEWIFVCINLFFSCNWTHFMILHRFCITCVRKSDNSTCSSTSTCYCIEHCSFIENSDYKHWQSLNADKTTSHSNHFRSSGHCREPYGSAGSHLK